MKLGYKGCDLRALRRGNQRTADAEDQVLDKLVAELAKGKPLEREA